MSDAMINLHQDTHAIRIWSGLRQLTNSAGRLFTGLWTEYFGAMRDHRELESERVRMIHEQAGTGLVITLLISAICVVAYWEKTPTPALLLWFFSQLWVAGWRIKSLREFPLRQARSGYQPIDEENLFVRTSLFIGLHWGILGSLMLPSDFLSHVLTAFVISIVGCGFSVTYSVSRQAVGVYIAVSFLPFVGQLLLSGKAVDHAVAALTSALAFGLIRVARRNGRQIIKATQLALEKQRLLRQLELAQVQIVRAAKMSALGEMSSGIAHEINNPLAVILGYAHSLAERAGTGRGSADDTIRLARRQIAMCERISTIVQSLKRFSRESSADPAQTVTVREIVSDTLELCAERFRNFGIELRVPVVADTASSLFCRPCEVSQVLLNLLMNAFDAVESCSTKIIEIGARDWGGFVEISVTDSGPGISPEHQAKIMQPFFTTKPVGRGTGLGLSISKGIAEGHGGDLLFDSSSPRTRFVIRLPKASGTN